MPRKGYKCITVTDKVHEVIRKRAKENNCTMRQYFEYLLANDKSTKKEKT